MYPWIDPFSYHYENAQSARRVALAAERFARASENAGDQIDQLKRENAQLRLYLQTLLTLLVDKKLISGAEFQDKLLSQLPPIPIAQSAEPENPFSNLDS